MSVLGIAGEPFAWKLARGVLREEFRNLPSKGDKALGILPYKESL